ncbi:MAG: prephenate dehydrogenase [Neisseriaceae bacterium]|nr:prephenate dehydrogenase [Neisseriaceae bacterium]
MKKITLIGVGLIGTSLIASLKRKGLVDFVTGIDPNAEHLHHAQSLLDDAQTELSQESLLADMIIIATPVGIVSNILKELAKFSLNRTIITDVGSTKRTILQAYQKYLPHHFSYCVAAHPIAGSERHGSLAAQENLFDGKKIIICPHEQQNEASLQMVQQMWEATGAEIIHMNADEHDGVFAHVSHMPHLLAYAFMQTILQSPNRETLLRLAGSGFRDFTRIAASHPDIWTDIAFNNTSAILNELKKYRDEIEQLISMIQTQDQQQLHDYLQQAHQLRSQW